MTSNLAKEALDDLKKRGVVREEYTTIDMGEWSGNRGSLSIHAFIRKHTGIFASLNTHVIAWRTNDDITDDIFRNKALFVCHLKSCSPDKLFIITRKTGFLLRTSSYTLHTKREFLEEYRQSDASKTNLTKISATFSDTLYLGLQPSHI